MIQAKQEYVNFSCKESSKYTTDLCKNIYFENLVPVLFCQRRDNVNLLDVVHTLRLHADFYYKY